jgi:excisionase family DNA binding protein
LTDSDKVSLDAEPDSPHDGSMSDPDDLLTTTEAGEILGVSGKTVSRYADLGTLPVLTLPSGHRRFRRSDIDDLLAAGRPA